MHIIQQKLLDLSKQVNLGSMTLREIGKLIGVDHPQKVKHHMKQLEKKGFLKSDGRHGIVEKIKDGLDAVSNLISIPILGTANCGPATFFADENFEGYLKVSPGIVHKRNGFFAIKASGNSMNRADIKGHSIEDGDFVIVNSDDKSPKDGDYVLSIIDDVANIKRFRIDKENNQIVLISESASDFPPIFIHPDDEFNVSGKVVQVIKKPRFD